MGTVRSPRPYVLAAASALDTAVAAFLEVRQPPSGEWEAVDDAYISSNLLVRHIEATIELARADELLLPSAYATARAALEVGARMRWILAPSDLFEREARWITRLAEEERFYNDLAKRYDSAGAEGDGWASVARQLADFQSAVTAQLPEGIKPPGGVPSVDSILKEANSESTYLLYKLASQYTHGTHFGGGMYRQHLGMAKQFEERITTKDWAGPFHMCWWSLMTAGDALLTAAGTEAGLFLTPALVNSVDVTLEAIRRAGPATPDDFR